MVISLAVVPNELDIVEGFLDEAILISPEFLVASAQIHGILDDEGIVGEAESSVDAFVPFQSTGFWKSYDSGLSRMFWIIVFIFLDSYFPISVVGLSFIEENIPSIIKLTQPKIKHTNHQITSKS
jgi:hypothetical protein